MTHPPGVRPFRNLEEPFDPTEVAIMAITVDPSRVGDGQVAIGYFLDRMRYKIIDDEWRITCTASTRTEYVWVPKELWQDSQCLLMCVSQNNQWFAAGMVARSI